MTSNRTVVVGETSLATFKRSWPCHGLDALRWCAFDFAPNGDLVDLRTYGERGPLDSHQFDGLALTALSRSVGEAR